MATRLSSQPSSGLTISTPGAPVPYPDAGASASGGGRTDRDELSVAGRRVPADGTGPADAGPVRDRLPSETDDEADRWLAGRVVRGDAQAFEVMVRRHQQRVFRIAYRITGSRADAEDVAQDVWIRVWGALASFTGASAFSTWLHRVTVNSSLNAVRRRATRTAHLDADGDADRVDRLARMPAADEVWEDHARSDAVRAAIAALEPDLRVVIVLRHFEGLTYDQLCDVLSLPEPTVRGRLARGRARLAVGLRGWR